MNMYKAKVVYYEEKELTEYCITSANTYAEAMKRIAKCYGEKNLEEVQISWLYDSAVLPVTEDVLSHLELY